MKSNICKIEKGAENLDVIFCESDKVAEYNELNHKHALQLRLLCEEIVNMLPAIVSNFSGEFWIETEGDYYELCLRALVKNMDLDTRERFINISKNNKNASIVGITGKIRAVFDYMVMGVNDPIVSPAGRYGFSTNVDFSQFWSLQDYRDSVKNDANGEEQEWDEFERSIIVKLADDVVVGVKGENVTIIIKKKFA